MSAHPETQSVIVNGDTRQVPVGSTLPDLLTAMDIDPSFSPGIAVAVNDEVVARERWKDVTLHPDDRVEIVSARQGG